MTAFPHLAPATPQPRESVRCREADPGVQTILLGGKHSTWLCVQVSRPALHAERLLAENLSSAPAEAARGHEVGEALR